MKDDYKRVPWAGGKELLQCDRCPFNIALSGKTDAMDERNMENHIRVRHLSPRPSREVMLRNRQTGETHIVGPDGRPISSS